MAVEEGGVGAAGAGGVVEEGEGKAGIPVRGPSRTRTKLRGAITTGSEVMTRRLRGQAHHLRREIVHWYAVEL